MWTIHFYLKYGLVDDYVHQRYKACVICGPNLTLHHFEELNKVVYECRAPKSLVDPLEGPSMRQCGRSWNLEHDPDFQH
jgi:hypothetical protein